MLPGGTKEKGGLNIYILHFFGKGMVMKNLDKKSLLVGIVIGFLLWRQ
jgi:hypothetical protein